MNSRRPACILALVLVAVLAAPVLAVETGFLWNGSHWQEMTGELKVAYVKGIGNMADFETASGPPGRGACLSKALTEELKTKSIAEVVAEVDKFYQENPQKLQTPVVAVILQRCTKICASPPAGGETKK